jgi:hypothetical protein
MFRKIPSLQYRKSAVPAVQTRFALNPIVRDRVRLVGVTLETDAHRANPNRLYVGVEARVRHHLPTGEVVEAWGETRWLDTAVYRNLLTEEEARAWLSTGFAPAANESR